MKHRINEIQNLFREQFSRDCSFVSKAPGRINLIGEHTDYNMGLAMPAAIDRSVEIAFGISEDMICHFKANDLDDSYSVSLGEINKADRSWVNYLLGILKAFKKRKGVDIGFDCVISSNIPVGAGMSSSAALECAFINGLNQLYNAQLTRWELIEIIQESAHHFLGIKSGILDQFASMFGQTDNAMMLDCETKEFKYFRISLKEHSFVLVDTKVKHTHLTSAYNDRVEECQSALNKIQSKYPHVQSLSERKLGLGMLEDLLLSEIELKRTRFIINENQRVIDFSEALVKEDIDRMGKLLYASHHGLAHEYQVSCPELDFLVEQTRNMTYVCGARMMGGGFGGCTLNLIDKDYSEQYQKEISGKYLDAFGINPDIYNVKLSDGAMIILD